MALVRVRELFDEAPWFWGCAGAGAVFVTGLVTWRAVSGSLRHKAIEKRRKNYREQKLQEKRAYAQRFNASKADVDKICSLSLQGLHEQLQSGLLSASQVHGAYVTKADSVDKKINCVTDYITEAEGKAKELDAATTKKPLHGLPFSIKELHAYKGYPSTSGVQTVIDLPAEETFELTKVLEDQGAVPFVRSNVPYTCMSYTCTNPLYGTTSNPYSTSRQPGGSSGGEAALVAAGATAISIGGDLGGSVRVPAAWCGVVGLKCGSTRLNSYMNLNGLPLDSLKTVLPAAYGPLSRDVESAAFIMRHLLVEDMFKPSPYTPPIAFREEIYQDKKPLRVGYYTHDNVTTTVPSFVRAVHVVKDKLQGQGHTLVPFDIPVDDGNGNRWIDMVMKVLVADGGEMLNMMVNGDDPGDLFRFPRMVYPSMPRWFNLLLTKIYQLFDKRSGQMMEYGCGTGSVFDWWIFVDSVLTWRRLVVEKMKQENIDVLLSPAFSCPALLEKHFLPLTDYSSYAVLYNLLDWPAGVVPVTKVTSEDIQQMDQFPSDSTTAKNIIESMQGAGGLPVAVQIAAPPYGEELCLRVMKEIEDAVKF